MKILFAAALTIMAASQVQAAPLERITKFKVSNPGVHCEIGTVSRSAGQRYITLKADAPSLLAKAASVKGIGLATRTKHEPMTVDWGKCEQLKNVPKVLTGEREIYIQRLEHKDDVGQRQCNAIVIEVVRVSLGKNNPTLSTKTAWAVVGDDLSDYNPLICELSEEDFQRVLDKADKK